MYTGNGNVQEFRYASMLQSAFSKSKPGLNGLQNLQNEGWVESDKATVFVSMQDTEREGTSLTTTAGNNAYALAQIFSLAHPYGNPTVMSGYAFTDPNAGPPNGGNGVCASDYGADGWYCQHRWTEVKNMVAFRQTAGSSALVNWVAPSASQIAFERQGNGFVAINYSGKTWKGTFKTGLPAGTYCDAISGQSGGACNVVVKGGEVAMSVPAWGAMAIHKGAMA
jgi:hypothetical protein